MNRVPGMKGITILSQLETVSSQTFEGPTHDAHFGTFWWSWMVTAFPSSSRPAVPLVQEEYVMFLPCHWASCSPVLRAQWKVWALASTLGWFHSHSSDNICWASFFCARLLPWNGSLPQECEAVSMLSDQTPGTHSPTPADPRLEDVAGPQCLLALTSDTAGTRPAFPHSLTSVPPREKAAVGPSVAMKHTGFSLNTDPALWS